MGNRGILSSLGAGLSLIVAGIIALSIVAGLVVVRGVKGLREDRSTPDVRMASVAAQKPVSTEPVVLGGAAARGDAASSVSSVSARRRAERGRRLRRGRGAQPDARRASEPGRSGDRQTAGSGLGSLPGADAGAGGSVVRAPSRRADPAGSLVDGVGRIAQDLTAPRPPGSPPVDIPQVTQDVTDVAGRVVGETQQTVADTVGGVPHLP